jgi:hypothetical protein
VTEARYEEISTRNGFTKLGIEKVGMLMTRGVLLDMAALKGVDTLPDDYEITVKDPGRHRLDRGPSRGPVTRRR